MEYCQFAPIDILPWPWYCGIGNRGRPLYPTMFGLPVPWLGGLCLCYFDESSSFPWPVWLLDILAKYLTTQGCVFLLTLSTIPSILVSELSPASFTGCTSGLISADVRAGGTLSEPSTAFRADEACADGSFFMNCHGHAKIVSEPFFSQYDCVCTLKLHLEVN